MVSDAPETDSFGSCEVVKLTFPLAGDTIWLVPEHTHEWKITIFGYAQFLFIIRPKGDCPWRADAAA